MAIMEKIGDTAKSVIDFKVFIFERTSWVCFSRIWQYFHSFNIVPQLNLSVCGICVVHSRWRCFEVMF